MPEPPNPFSRGRLAPSYLLRGLELQTFADLGSNIVEVSRGLAARNEELLERLENRNKNVESIRETVFSEDQPKDVIAPASVINMVGNDELGQLLSCSCNNSSLIVHVTESPSNDDDLSEDDDDIVCIPPEFAKKLVALEEGFAETGRKHIILEQIHANGRRRKQNNLAEQQSGISFKEHLRKIRNICRKNIPIMASATALAMLTALALWSFKYLIRDGLWAGDAQNENNISIAILSSGTNLVQWTAEKNATTFADNNMTFSFGASYF